MRPFWPSLLRRILLGSIPFLALLGIWHVGSQRSLVVPSIPEVFNVLAHPLAEPVGIDAPPLAESVCVSLLRVACGFALAALTALPVGLLIGRWRWARELFAPVTAAATAISPIAWVPVMILVFGFTSPASLLYGQNHWKHDLLDQLWLAYLAVIWIGAFFPMTVNIAAAAGGVRNSYIEAATAYGASRRQRLLKVIFPAAAPGILTALRIGGGISWRVIIAAEVFPGTRGGLGYTIVNGQTTGEFQYAFAAILLIATVGLCLDATLAWIARGVGRWQIRER